MHDVGCPLTFCLVLAIGSCLVTANPYTNELEEVAAAAEKRGWNNFHAGYGKRAWNSFNAGYGKRAYDYDEEPESMYDTEEEKRAWNSGFASGMGKRAWNSGFAGGIGKRAWNSFNGGYGKRAWNSFTGGGYGKRNYEMPEGGAAK